MVSKNLEVRLEPFIPFKTTSFELYSQRECISISAFALSSPQKESPEGVRVPAGQPGRGGERQSGGAEAEEEAGGGHQRSGGAGGPAHQEQRRAQQEQQEDAAADQGPLIALCAVFTAPYKLIDAQTQKTLLCVTWVFM